MATIKGKLISIKIGGVAIENQGGPLTIEVPEYYMGQKIDFEAGGVIYTGGYVTDIKKNGLCINGIFIPNGTKIWKL
jgi:hypothetical protein